MPSLNLLKQASRTTVAVAAYSGLNTAADSLKSAVRSLFKTSRESAKKNVPQTIRNELPDEAIIQWFKGIRRLDEPRSEPGVAAETPLREEIRAMKEKISQADQQQADVRARMGGIGRRMLADS